jgi:hypothetical protein
MRLSLTKFLVAVVGAIFSLQSAAQEPEVVPGEVIVKLRGAKGPGRASQALGKMTSQKGMNVKRAWGKMGMYHFTFQKGKSMKAQLDELNSDPDVEYAEPNYILHKASDVGILETYSQSEVLEIVDAEGLGALGVAESVQSAWKYSGASVGAQAAVPVIAVIDTGLDVSHQVFLNTDSIWENSDEISGNGVDDDGNGYIDDVNGWNFVDNSGTMYDDDGHGTHVSGIILNVDQNIHVPAGDLVTAGIKIMPLKFLNGSGSGSTSDAIEAIYYAVQNGATVLNNSWGGTSYSAALHEAVTYSYDNGVSFIAAAGNAGSNNDSVPMYPASYDVPNVIAVAATYDNFELTGFSNYGKKSVDLGAWGYFINSTVPGGAFGDSSGTSMSAPFVAGTAVQMVAQAPGMLGYQVKQIIEEETEYRSALVNKVQTQGRLHPDDSISKASTSVVATSQPDYNTNFSNNRELASEIAGGGCGMVDQMTAQYRGSGYNNGSGGESGELMHGGGMRMPGPKTWYVLLLMGILLAPILIATHLRRRGVVNQRAHQRYKIDSDVRVKVGEKELVGSVSSISLGGVQVNTDELLENGGIVSMTISSPEGKEQIQVEGRVVWSKEKKAYGVAFQDASLSALDRISNWTQGLKKSS